MWSLSPNACRVLGCLLEKEVTVPATYPLTLNALLSACNQSSGRDPVLHLDEADGRGRHRRAARGRLRPTRARQPRRPLGEVPAGGHRRARARRAAPGGRDAAAAAGTADPRRAADAERAPAPVRVGRRGRSHARAPGRTRRAARRAAAPPPRAEGVALGPPARRRRRSMRRPAPAPRWLLAGRAGRDPRRGRRSCAAFVGTWTGAGEGHYPSIADFGYTEQIELRHGARQADARLPVGHPGRRRRSDVARRVGLPPRGRRRDWSSWWWPRAAGVIEAADGVVDGDEIVLTSTVGGRYADGQGGDRRPSAATAWWATRSPTRSPWPRWGSRCSPTCRPPCTATPEASARRSVRLVGEDRRHAAEAELGGVLERLDRPVHRALVLDVAGQVAQHERRRDQRRGRRRRSPRGGCRR